MCTAAGDHPYAEAWWPDAHILGYEHGLVDEVLHEEEDGKKKKDKDKDKDKKNNKDKKDSQ